MTLFTESVIIKDRAVTGEDAYGNDVYTPSERTSEAWLQVGSASEDVEGRQQASETTWLYLPPGDPISATAAVVWRGLEYEVNGMPQHQPGGFVVEGFVQVALRRVTG